jgi:glycosyltransferase involved in cell wall biosynthesis
MATLAQLRAATQHPYELLVLGDGPDAALRATLRRLPGVEQSTTARPLGATACFNRLAAESDAEVVVFLESGARVGPGWLELLLAALLADRRHGLAGPSTNRAWNRQQAFPECGGSPAALLGAAREARRRYGSAWQSLAPLYCLADFCYAVRRPVIEAVGGADEAYGAGPCWEMDYTARAVRAGFRAVWAQGAFVYRSPATARRQHDERLWWEDNRRRYQDRLCGRRLRGEQGPYAAHCRGEECRHFAPAELIEIRLPLRQARRPGDGAPGSRAADGPPVAEAMPLVSCIMPTSQRPRWMRQAAAYFQRQDYPNRELIVVDDGTVDQSHCLPDDPAIRYIRLPERLSIGAKRNHACRLARGELIAQWDDDDWYAPERLSVQVGPLLRGTADITGLYGTTFFELEDGAFWGCTPRLHARLFRPGDVHSGTLVFRKTLFERGVCYPDTSLAEDAGFLSQALERSARLRRLAGEALYVYLRHGGNSWRFRCGEFLDPSGWLRRRAPAGFAADGAFYREHAAELRPAAAEREHARAQAAPAIALPGRALPLVSCIMPTHNRRPFVSKAIEYFRRQDYPNKELVILDDGSDPVADLVPPGGEIHYHRLHRRQSVGAKRNMAIEASGGEIIVHWDDDDWMHPERISVQVSRLLAAGADICGASQVVFCQLGAGRLWLYRYPKGTRRRWLSGSTLCYRRELWQRKRFPTLNIGEDTRFVLSDPQGEMLDLAPFPRLVAMVHPGNTSAKRLTGALWSPWNEVGPRALMGEDWGFYLAFAHGMRGAAG